MSMVLEDNVVYGKETIFEKVKIGELFVDTYKYNNKTRYLSAKIKIGPKTAIGMGARFKERMKKDDRVTLIDKILLEQFKY